MMTQFRREVLLRIEIGDSDLIASITYHEKLKEEGFIVFSEDLRTWKLTDKGVKEILPTDCYLKKIPVIGFKKFNNKGSHHVKH